MLENFRKSRFCKNWGNFFGILLSPGSVIPLIGAGISLWLSTRLTGAFSIFLSIFSSILAVVAGYFINSDWEKARGNSLLEKKGRSAIRNLQSIGQQIVKIKEWSRSFMSAVGKDSSKRSLEEIGRHLCTTEMNIQSGIDDWTDIIPELKEEKEKLAEEFKKYEDAIRAYREELLKVKKQILVIGKDDAQKKELEKRVKDLEKNIKELKREPVQLFSGASVVSNIASSVAFGDKLCSMCGRPYIDDYSTPMLHGSNICLECRKKYFGPDNPTGVVSR